MRCAFTLSCGTNVWIQSAGYVASLLVFATFYMKTMVPLRVVAISSNVAFIAYAFFDSLYPILILHSVLLPLNLSRTIQILRINRSVDKAVKGDFPVECFRPFMKVAKWKAGETIFNRGDRADRLYVLVSGTVRLDEIDCLLESGDLFGEIGLFSAAHRRTQTARALTDVELLWLTENELAQVCYQNSAVALYFLRLSTTRLITNAVRNVDRVPPSIQPFGGEIRMSSKTSAYSQAKPVRLASQELRPLNAEPSRH